MGLIILPFQGGKGITLIYFHRALPHAKIYLAFSQSLRFVLDLIVLSIFSNRLQLKSNADTEKKKMFSP